MADAELDEFLAAWDITGDGFDYDYFEDPYAEPPEDDDPPCTCVQIDVDLADNRYCEAHGGRRRT